MKSIIPPGARSLKYAFTSGLRASVVGGLLLVVSSLVNAAGNGDLYSSTVKVESQSAQDRKNGLVEGMSRVVIRLSGRSSAVSAPEIIAAAKTPERYLARYSYARGTSTSTSTSDGLSESPALLLKMQFDRQLMQNLLQRAELPMWVAGRPTVLVWCVVRKGKDSTIVTPKTLPKVAALIEQEMARRGVPMVWPNLGSADPEMLSHRDLQKLDAEKIWQASVRYGEQAVLAGSIKITEDEQWLGNWLYVSNAQQQRLRNADGAPQQVVASAVNSMAEELSNRFSVQVSGGEAQSLNIEVLGIGDFSDYSRTLKHLNSIAVVKAADVVTVAPGKVVFQLNLQGSQEQLADSLSMHNILRPSDVAVGYEESGNYSNNLRYELR